MSLSPEINIPELYESSPRPSRTYQLDFKTKRIGRNKIDGIAAIEQFIYKTIRTPRFRYAIYSAAVGCEIQDVIGTEVTDAFKETEIMRMITESLIYDDRINRVYDFDITIAGDAVYIKFSVDTIEGTINIGEGVENG